MKTSLTYGFFMALGGALLSMALYFLGFHSDVDKLQTAQWIGSGGGLLIGITCIVLAMRERRANTPPTTGWGYGSALGTGVLTGLFGCVFGAVYNYIYFTVINRGMVDLIFQAQVAKMEAKGMSSDQIEKIEPMMRKMMSPVMTTIWGLVVGFVFCVLIALVAAAFVKSRAAAQPATPPVV